MSLALRLLHAALALVLIGWLVSAYVDRRADLGKVRETTAQERGETSRLQQELERGRALRDGLRRDDPYVVEFLARERLQYSGPGEMSPPPR